MGTEKTAAQEHEQAAKQVDRARGLVGQALGQIEDISRGMKETTKTAKRPLSAPLNNTLIRLEGTIDTWISRVDFQTSS
jgi:hypothetical protein